MAKVTYHAPAGDEAVVTIGGLRFFDGQGLDVDPGQHGQLLGKLSGNPHFTVDGLTAADDDTPDDPPAAIGLRAIHRGRGKYSIVRGDEDKEIREGLNKTDAAAFNSMSDEDKESYVA